MKKVLVAIVLATGAGFVVGSNKTLLKDLIEKRKDMLGLSYAQDSRP